MILTYQDLTNNALIDHAKQTLKNKEELTFYIDKTIGFQVLQRYPVIEYGTIQTEDIQIYTVSHDSSKQQFIRNIFYKLDNLIDLDFLEMTHNNGSMLDIYHVNYSSTFQDNVVGQALPQRSEAGSWSDILWKTADSINESNFGSDLNTIVHEIGHTLGLGHPQNEPTNPLWDSEDTIMSYNKGQNGWNKWFSDIDLNALISIWGREDDLGIMSFDKNNYKYKYVQKSDNQYYIKTDIGLEIISDVRELRFSNKSILVQEDVIEVFSQVKDINDISGKIYRLYNASFGRFPDKDGLEYWINKNKTGTDSFRVTAKSFIKSNEFINLYGLESSNSEFIKSLYSNILDREPDINGFNYWSNQINSGLEDRSELLMGFSESIENKQIFSAETNLY